MRYLMIKVADTIQAAYKQDRFNFIKITALALCTIMSIVSVLLFYEYRFFQRETKKVIELKEDYRNYIVAVKKILADYTKTKERLEELEAYVVDKEKKNDIDELELSSAQTTFPEGVRVYSSDDEVEDTAQFVVINRELEYLKQSTLDYLKQQKLASLMQHIDAYAWYEYTDQVLEKSKQEKNQKKRPRRKVAYKRQRSWSKADEVAVKHSVSDINFCWPIDRSSFWLSSKFGPRKKPNGAWGFHSGLDMAAVKGTPVNAVNHGVVVEARYAKGYGKTVVIAHNNKYRTRYAHLNNIHVEVGQEVEKGQCIGKVGATGFVRSKRGGDASHLHFEVYVYGKPVNPLYFLG